MTEPDPSQLHLNRIDPARNMRRFYRLTTQPTLFGEVALVRDWGRIGTYGQSMMQTFADDEAARKAFQKLERSKRQRGYVK